jgi:hypothetical protein
MHVFQYDSALPDSLFAAASEVPCAQEAWKLFRYARQRGTPVSHNRYRQCLKVAYPFAYIGYYLLARVLACLLMNLTPMAA